MRLQECEELTARGISGTGVGFDAPAAGKAGGRFEGRGLSAQRLRELALRAAEGRLQKQALMPVGPRTAGTLVLQACPLLEQQRAVVPFCVHPLASARSA